MYIYIYIYNAISANNLFSNYYLTCLDWTRTAHRRNGHAIMT